MTLIPYHQPVMVQEVLQALQVQRGGLYIDCTAGEGGHTQAILQHSLPGGRVLALDADPAAIDAINLRLQAFLPHLVAVHSSYTKVESVASHHGFVPADGMLIDLGLSSMQLQASGRGFSFQRDELLDMRFDSSQPLTAADIVNTYTQEELADLIWTLGEERRSRPIARAIIAARPIHTSARLAEVIARAAGGRREGIHPATRAFQALRIAVNKELENLQSWLSQTLRILKPGGRMAVISYHSLEDRLVKEFLRRESRDCLCPPATPLCVCGHKAALRLVNKKVITPSREEIARNPRSRSAKLRVAERLPLADQQLSTTN
ncbi:MAG: 16S rRNA (cytosine(1402)-N(4))-methyltransferase RsmH [SAR202 cluster bacterium]|nr:16S rRNA (cytosine(1402)-N(4))-methyltransferase RsmH [SAR202 cluster bacterium]